MQETYISFYLKANRIHIFVGTLRGLGNPSRICFMIEENGKTLLLAPYEKRDFKSIGVPADVYNGTGCMEVSSMKLCHIIAGLHHWDLERSYRIPGKIHTVYNVAIFSLTDAEVIDRPNVGQSEWRKMTKNAPLTVKSENRLLTPVSKSDKLSMNST